MPIIKQLDQHTANLIAAGEVIERAASVVKELVENSIDANAKNIEIHLIDSGITEIRVIDDGCGMDQVDARMCVLPHATSKIKGSDDLFSIKTLGFRGEALSSIVAVSNFKLTSSIDGHKGYMYSLKGGILTSEAIVAHSRGTEIVVKNLFYNTPARLQNLQSQNVELSHISDLVTKIALCRPDISFLLTNNGKVLIQSNGSGDLLETISSVLNVEVAKNMIKFFDTNGTYRIEGFISNLSITRSSKNYIYLFINGRIVKSNNICNAIVKGYDTLLMTGKYPVTVINIEADASIVDVNVHPTKAEVRFSDESKLTDLITKAIAETLNNHNLSVNISYLQSEYQNNEEIFENKFDFNEDEDEVDVEEETFADEFYFEESEERPFILEEEKPLEESLDKEEIFIQQQYDLFGEGIEDENTIKIDKIGKLNYIGQLFGTYLIAQTDNDLVIIDQHAAAERINYEKILKELEKDDNIAYDLLVPFNLEFSPSDAVLINDYIAEINKLGILIEDFGNNTFTIRRIPIWIFRGKEQEFVEEIITQIIHGKKSTKKEFLNSLAKSLACKRSIKANEYHNKIEIEYLLDDLRNTSNPFTCPHGRPIIIKFDKYEIEKWFKRVV